MWSPFPLLCQEEVHCIKNLSEKITFLSFKLDRDLQLLANELSMEKKKHVALWNVSMSKKFKWYPCSCLCFIKYLNCCVSLLVSMEHFLPEIYLKAVYKYFPYWYFSFQISPYQCLRNECTEIYQNHTVSHWELPLSVVSSSWGIGSYSQTLK